MKIMDNPEYNAAKAILELAIPILQQTVNESAVCKNSWEIQKVMLGSRLKDFVDPLMVSMHQCVISAYAVRMYPIEDGYYSCTIELEVDLYRGAQKHKCLVGCWNKEGFNIKFLQWSEQ